MKRELLAHAVWKTIEVVISGIFIAASSLLASGVVADTIKTLSPYRNYIIIIIATVLVILLAFVYKRLHKNKPDFPNLDFDYRILEKEITITFYSRKKINYTKRLIIKSLVDNLRCFRDKYHWTGGSEVNIVSGTKGHTVQKTYKKNIFQFYEIIFPHNLHKGDTIETKVIWDLSDTNEIMVPFISATIEEPTDLLLMNVSFHDIMQVNYVICEISSSIGADRPFETQKCELDSNKKYTWRISNPRLLFHYEMSWIF